MDSTTSWENVQPIFSENCKITNKIILVEDNENIISDDKLESEELNNFLKNPPKLSIYLKIHIKRTT